MFPVWKEAPFLRLLTPFITGILLQWYVMPPLHWLLSTLASATLTLAFIQLASIPSRFRLRQLTGICINLLLVATGSLITWLNYPAHNQSWLPLRYTGTESIRAMVQEPLVPKSNSFKATAAVRQLFSKGNITPVSGNIIVYFSQDVKVTEISYGSIIIINKPLAPVKNSGNPGAFNYQRYCTFAQIGYQVFLQPKDFVLSPGSETRGLQRLIFTCRQKILSTLSTYIKGAKEKALAEALLIGYKDELDNDLVQSYSNTGVVHIIAVSGMHLGIIYLLLSRLLQPFRNKRSTRWAGAVLMLAALWAFSLLAGGGPSVVRSALMFSMMIIGEAFSKRSNVYNNLAASAFLLLCWNPFWLWDAGFQLSYAAVLSIVLFFKPVYNLVFFQNKLLDGIWKLNAVTISAQLLTLPFTIYLFHQFPNLFLLSNLVAVPLSSILLIGEILLCAVSFIPALASITGAALNFLLHFMNDFIERIDALPFASWTHLYLGIPQAVLLMIIIIATAVWLMQRSRPAFMTAVAAFSLFMVFRSYSFMAASAQRKLIIYNVSRTAAMDLIEGRHYYFAGDTSIQPNPLLEPSRTLYRVAESSSLPSLLGKGACFWFNGKRILVVDDKLTGDLELPANMDLLVLSKNPRLRLETLLQNGKPLQVVADASNAAWKTLQWQQTCAALNIPFHNVAQNGAFIMEIQ